MVTVFHDEFTEDAHDLFQAWRRDHPDGFCINCKSRNSWMVHRVTCGHMGSMELGRDAGGSLTRLKKVCSGELRELIDWARQTGTASVTLCSYCAPEENVPEPSNLLATAAQHLAETGVFDPTGITDARERVLSSIVRRRGQPAFRERLLAAYQGRCAVTGCPVEAVLDAAHIVPFQGPDTNHVGNGLLLRTDLHTLFDLGLVAVDAGPMTLLVSPALAGTCYEEYHGRPVSVPDDPASQPSREALEQHCRESGLAKVLQRTASAPAASPG